MEFSSNQVFNVFSCLYVASSNQNKNQPKKGLFDVDIGPLVEVVEDIEAVVEEAGEEGFGEVFFGCKCLIVTYCPLFVGPPITCKITRKQYKITILTLC